MNLVSTDGAIMMGTKSTVYTCITFIHVFIKADHPVTLTFYAVIDLPENLLLVMVLGLLKQF